MLKLNHRKYGAGPPLIILHGLFGSSDNWHTLANRWSQAYTVYTLDLRNHGASPHDSYMSYSDMVEDLSLFITDQRLSQVKLIGHSMGGKVAMLFASRFPELVDGLVVLDIGMGKTEGKHLPILKALNDIHPEDFSHRQDIQRELEKYVDSADIRQFLLKNVLRRVDGSFAWKFNRDILLQTYDQLTGALDLPESYMGPALFLKGSYSDYMNEELDPETLQFFPMAQLEIITDAGHWLHAEQPEQVFQAVHNFLSFA